MLANTNTQDNLNTVPADMKLLGVKDTCKVIGCCQDTLRRLRRSGKIKPVMVGNRAYYTLAEIRRFMGLA